MTKIIIKIPVADYNNMAQHRLNCKKANGEKITVVEMCESLLKKAKIPEIIDIPRDAFSGEGSTANIEVPENIHRKISECADKSSIKFGRLVTIHNITVHCILTVFRSIYKY